MDFYVLIAECYRDAGVCSRLGTRSGGQQWQTVCVWFKGEGIVWIGRGEMRNLATAPGCGWNGYWNAHSELECASGAVIKSGPVHSFQQLLA